ncbi:MAG: deoxyribose-phosphate aldolase [Candidatus Gastranaerophilales bacterium]|nr:deoxyribose-phosphate aldolase [Candidatus Gastranaerophilales bacterium]
MNLKKYIEHTLLKQDATENEIRQLAKEAIDNDFLGICVNPVNVKIAKEFLAGSKIKLVTVVGFPFGASHSDVKAFEAEQAIKDGADEIDMVINIGALKDKNYRKVQDDIIKVVRASGDKSVKVIIETDLLRKEEIILASGICAKTSAKFVKTSTGFVKNGTGAKAEDVKLMYDTVKAYGLQVKASGGIRTKEDALAMIEAGATRLGTSSGIKIVKI